MKTTAFALSVLLLAAAARADEPKIERKPLHVAALNEFGQLGKGIFKVGTQGNAETLQMEWIDHFGAFINQEAVVNDRLFVCAGLGGVFQYRKPERIQADFYGTQRGEFYIGPTKAFAEYRFGEVEKPIVSVGTGMFGYKYNNEAYNLGEYLYRTLPYPTVITTGGYVLVNDPVAYLEGFKASLNVGEFVNFRLDALLTTETNLAPLFDWSLGLVGALNIGEGLFEVGAGINFKKLIQVNPSRTARELKQNGYFTFQGKEYVTGVDYYNRHAEWYRNRGDTVTAARYEADKAIVDSMTSWRRQRDTGNVTVPNPPDTSYFTAAGTLLMGRFSFDPKKLMGDGGPFGPNDLKLYGEAAVLGVKNYPVFYKKITDRLPLMLGFNVPAFGFLDLVAVQVEWFKSPWLNNTAQVGNRGINIPHFPLTSDSLLSEKAYNDMTTKDDFKWSVLIQKKLGNHITVSGQAASDHMKLVSSRYFYGPQFDHNEITTASDHWYYMLQIGWGI